MILSSSESAVRDALVEMYADQIVEHGLRSEASLNQLFIRLKSGPTVLINLTKLASLYESGTSIAAIKAASGFEHLSPFSSNKQ